MNQHQYYETRDHLAAMFYPQLRPRDIGLYVTVYENTVTREKLVHREWRPHGRPHLRAAPKLVLGPEWAPIEWWTWQFPPTVEDVV